LHENYDFYSTLNFGTSNDVDHWLEQKYYSANITPSSGIQDLGDQSTPEDVIQTDPSVESGQSPGSLFSSGSSAQTQDSGSSGIDPSLTTVNEIDFQLGPTDYGFLAVMQFLRELELPQPIQPIMPIMSIVPIMPVLPTLPIMPDPPISKVPITRATTFSCCHCQSAYPCSRSLKRHVESSHRMITCDFDGCVSTFRTQRDAKRHKNSVHSRKKLRSRCDRGFSRRDLVLRHERSCSSCATPPVLADNADLNQEDEEEDEWTNFAEYFLAQPYG